MESRFPRFLMTKFDYIIAGAGCAGLSLLVRLLQTGRFNDRQFLLVDRAPKTSNDRTWCFWERSPGLFDHLVYKKWRQLWLHDHEHSALYDIRPYEYKLIRSIDFYQYCMDYIRQFPNVQIEYGEITGMREEANGAAIQLGGQWIFSEFIFNSILLQPPVIQKHEHFLLQHFKGWVIETSEPVFDVDKATLMDFRVDQSPGTAFVYVLPFAANKALVEYTIFSENILSPEVYDAALHQYIHQYITASYSLCDTEWGVIPMTNHRFPSRTGNIIHIGTAGGQTKASSGYTFQFIQKQTAQLTAAMLQKGRPMAVPGPPRRFHFYDSTLLNILSGRKLPGQQIFTTLFRKNRPTRVLQFLDNETTLWQELTIITVLPRQIFLKAAWEELFRP